MKDDLAEELLARVMNWRTEDVARERPLLQAMAKLKYDEYQQFSPGMRFVERLTLWLDQFPKELRGQAYQFVRNRLVFVSNAEMAHLVSMAYPDYIRPLLLDLTAQDLGWVSGSQKFRIQELSSLEEFRIIKRRTLVLALSDGARTDTFRRSTKELSHEQIWQAYDISLDKAKSMQRKLHLDLKAILGREPKAEENTFRVLCLVDDFSASGTSYLMAENGKWAGKIASISEMLAEKTQCPSGDFMSRTNRLADGPS